MFGGEGRNVRLLSSLRNCGTLIRIKDLQDADTEGFVEGEAVM